jgi:opacity protein-like surface antigen
LLYGTPGSPYYIPETSESATGSSTGFHVGGFAEFDVADKIALQPGVSYISNSGGGIFNIPLLAKYKVAEKFGIVAGPSIYMWSATTPDGSQSKTLIDITAGGNYDITENIFAEAHYSLGLGGDYKIGNFMIGAGYKF